MLLNHWNFCLLFAATCLQFVDSLCTLPNDDSFVYSLESHSSTTEAQLTLQNNTFHFNTQASNTEFHIGDRVMTSCSNSTQFVLIGANVLTCTDQHEWDRPVPQCKRLCPIPVAPRDGNVSYICSYIGCTATYNCNEGTVIQRGSNRSCADDGLWDGQHAPFCISIVCEPPDQLSNINQTFSQSPVSGTAYRYNTTVIYNCTASGFILYGDEIRRCQQNRHWSGSNPQCIPSHVAPVSTTLADEPVTNAVLPSLDVAMATESDGNVLPKSNTANDSSIPELNTNTNVAIELQSSTISSAISRNSTSATASITSTNMPPVMPSMCGSVDIVEHAVVHSNETTVIYICDTGYILDGENVRYCLDNKTWSAQTPTCIDATVMTTMNPRVSINTIGLNHWRKVYHGHRYWAGTYKYRGRTYKIRLLLEDHEVSEYVVGNVSAEKARFKVKGYRKSNGLITFEMTNLLVSSPHFSSTSWSMQGDLQKDHCTWEYLGSLHSTANGFETFQLRSVNNLWKPENCSHIPGINQAMAIGISTALIIVIVVGAVVFYFTRKASGVTATGHRTLTSFENPVYEYEHGNLRAK